MRKKPDAASPPTHTLHTLNASTREYRVLFDRMIQCASPGDSVLLIENGVYSLANEHTLRTFHAMGIALYCLEADMQARGLTLALVDAHRLPELPPVRMVDDAGFVALCGSHRKVISWFP